MLLTLNEISIQLLAPSHKGHVEIIPPSQLRSRLIDLCKIFVKQSEDDSGFLDFVVDYYHRNHPTTYDRVLGS
jgi:hypothetical protein